MQLLSIIVATILYLNHQSAIDNYKNASDIYSNELKDSIQQTYDRKQRAYSDYFDYREDKIKAEIDVISKELEINLINFIKNNPTSIYAPYARFQLATIYFNANENNPRQLEIAQQQLEIVLQFKSKDFPYIEETLYLLAYCYLQQNKEKQALNTFAELTRQYSSSRFLPEASLRIGEYYFHKQDYKTAERYYKKALVPKHTLYHKAQYKLAWSYYLRGDYRQSFDTFQKLVIFGENTEFYKESMEYLALSLYYTEKPSTAIQYLLQTGSSQKTFLIGMKYAELLDNDGKYKEAASIYKTLSKLSISEEEKASALFASTSSSRRLGDQLKANESTLEFLKTAPENHPKRDQALFDLGSYYYNLWFKNQNDTRQLRLAQLYFQEIIIRHPNTLFYYNSLFYTAEAAYAQKEYADAVNYYQQVIYSQQYAHHFNNAIQSVVIAQENRLRTSQNPNEKRQISEQLLFALDKYIESTDEQLTKGQLTLRSAQLLHFLDRTDEAVKRLDRLLQEQIDKNLAKSSILEILGMYAERQDWDLVIFWSDKYQKIPWLNAIPDITKTLRAAEFDALIAQAELAQKNNNHLNAANHYLEAYKTIDDHNRSNEILLYAISILRNEKRYDLALQAFEYVSETSDLLNSEPKIFLEYLTLTIDILDFSRATTLAKYKVLDKQGKIDFQRGRLYFALGQHDAAINVLISAFVKGDRDQRLDTIVLVEKLMRYASDEFQSTYLDKLVAATKETDFMLMAAFHNIDQNELNAADKLYTQIAKRQLTIVQQCNLHLIGGSICPESF